MIWAIIIVAIIFIIYKFSSDRNKQNSALKAIGGVQTKYARLIKILQADSNPTIIQNDNDLFAFGWFTPNAGNKFQIIQTFTHVTIKWNFKGKISFLNKTITLSKEWRFPETDNQEEIAHKVLTEMTELYNNSEFGKY